MTIKLCGSDHKRTPHTIEISNRTSSYGKNLCYSKVGSIAHDRGFVFKNVDTALAALTAYDRFAKDGQILEPEYKVWLSKMQKYQKSSSITVEGQQPLGWVLGSGIVGLIEMRKSILIPMYADAVSKTREWKLIQIHYDKFGYLELLDPSLPVTHKSLKAALNDPDCHFSPIYVLAMMLIYGTLVDAEFIV